MVEELWDHEPKLHTWTFNIIFKKDVKTETYVHQMAKSVSHCWITMLAVYQKFVYIIYFVIFGIT